MIKIKISDILQNQSSFEIIFNKVYPSATTFKFVTIFEELKRIIENFNKARDVLFARYGEDFWIDEEGNSVEKDTPGARSGKRIKLENEQVFQNEIQDLVESEVGIMIEPISIKDLGEKHELTPVQMSVIKEFLKND